MLGVKSKVKNPVRVNFNQGRSILRFLCSAAALCCALAAIKLPTQDFKVLNNQEKKAQLTAYLDVSNSISSELGTDLLQALKPYAKDFNLKIQAFSNKISEYEIAFEDKLSFEQIRKASKDLDLNQSQLWTLLNQNREAKALLLSDGHNTAYSKQLSSEQNLTKTTAIYPIIPENPAKFKSVLEILDFSSPSQAHKNEALKLNLNLQNHANQAQDLLISFYSDKTEIKTISAKLEAKAIQHFEVTSEFKEQELAEYRAVIEIQNSAKNKATQEIRSYTQSSLENEVLLINSDLKEAHNIIGLLKEEGLLVKSLLPAELAAAKLKLKDYSLIVFNNVPKSAFSNAFIEEIVTYVETGGKFLMLGGNKSFGLGGYKFTAIEELLPVILVKPQAEEQRLNLAVQLLLDKSFSMEDGEKIEFAKLAAREVYKTLKDDDYFGVIGFEDQMFEAIRLTPVRNLRGLAENRISLLFPAGGTQLLPALGTAANRLDLVQAGRKHLIILTDGKLPDGYPNQRYYLELVDNLRLSGVTVSCFLIGGESDFLLDEMAKRGGGAYHRTNDASSLPRLFIQDVSRSGQELTKHESQNFPVQNISIEDPDLQRFPAVTGYVETQLKPSAELSLSVSDQEKSYPLLAFKTIMQGKTAVFTSDLNTRWSRDWYLWPKFKKFIRHFLGKLDLNFDQSENKLDYNLQYQQAANQLSFLLNIYNQHNEADLKVFLKSKNAQVNAEAIQLTQNAVGAYSFQSLVAEPGQYELQIQYKAQQLKPFIFYVNPAGFVEQDKLGINLQYLNQLAKSTAGEVNPKLESLKVAEGKEELKEEQQLTNFQINKIFLFLAFGFFILEVLIRKRVYY